MELGLFDQVADLVRSMVPDGLGDLGIRTHRRGAKVWFGSERPAKEHYEAQFISRRHLSGGERGGDGPALEVGFHAEHADDSKNEATLARLVAKRDAWQDVLGGEAEAGPFLGNDGWRRISDVWLDVDPSDPELAFEIAGRLVDYIELLEPIRQGG